MESITNNNPEKIKDPKRVASGKRLGAISKEAKERKARSRVEQSEQCERNSDREQSYRFNFGHVIGTVGAITGIGALYFAYKKDKSQTSSTPSLPPSSTTFTPKPDLESFD